MFDDVRFCFSWNCRKVNLIKKLSDKMEENDKEEDEEDQFVRACGIITEIDTTIYRNLLHCQIAPEDCTDVANKIRDIGTEQLREARNVEVVGHYNDCHLLVMYLLLSKGCAKIQRPSVGWSGIPVTGTGLGDDIQRIWEMKCYVLSRRHAGVLELGKYKELIKATYDICRRMDGNNVRFNIMYCPFPSFVATLDTFLSSPLDATNKMEYRQRLEDLATREIEMCTEKENFAKMCRVVLDLNPLILQDVLDEQLPWTDCPTKAARLWPRLLSRDQLAAVNNVPTNGYTACDTSLMYIMLRNVCTNIPAPTPGWDKVPTGYDIGDDIERIRQTRNKIGHAQFASLSTSDYNQLIREANDICFRFDTKQSHSRYTNQRRDLYCPKLKEIEIQSLDRKQQEKYTMKLEDMKEKDGKVLETVNVAKKEILAEVKELRRTISVRDRVHNANRQILAEGNSRKNIKQMTRTQQNIDKKDKDVSLKIEAAQREIISEVRKTKTEISDQVGSFYKTINRQEGNLRETVRVAHQDIIAEVKGARKENAQRDRALMDKIRGTCTCNERTTM